MIVLGLAFIINSGLNVPKPAIPMPDLAVPKAAPTATWQNQRSLKTTHGLSVLLNIICNVKTTSVSGIIQQLFWRGLTAEATPANPKKGAYGGHSSDDIAAGEYTTKVLSEQAGCGRLTTVETSNGAPLRDHVQIVHILVYPCFVRHTHASLKAKNCTVRISRRR